MSEEVYEVLSASQNDLISFKRNSTSLHTANLFCNAFNHFFRSQSVSSRQKRIITRVNVVVIEFCNFYVTISTRQSRCTHKVHHPRRILVMHSDWVREMLIHAFYKFRFLSRSALYSNVHHLFHAVCVDFPIHRFLRFINRRATAAGVREHVRY